MEFTGHTKISGSNSLPNALIKPVFGVKKGGNPFNTITSGLTNVIQTVGDSTKDVGNTIQGHFNRFLNNTMFTSETKNELPPVQADIEPQGIQPDIDAPLSVAPVAPIGTDVLNEESENPINTPRPLDTPIIPVGGRRTKKSKKTRKHKAHKQHKKGVKHIKHTVKKIKIHNKKKNAQKKH